MKIVYKRNTRESRAAFWIRSFLTAWLLAASFEYWILETERGNLSGLDGVAAMSPGRMFGIGSAVMVLLRLLRKRLSERCQRCILAVAFGLLAGRALITSFTWPLLIACLLILGSVCVYAVRGWYQRKI